MFYKKLILLKYIKIVNIIIEFKKSLWLMQNLKINYKFTKNFKIV